MNLQTDDELLSRGIGLLKGVCVQNAIQHSSSRGLLGCDDVSEVLAAEQINKRTNKQTNKQTWLTCCVWSPKAVSTDRGPLCNWGQWPVPRGSPAATNHVASTWSTAPSRCCYPAARPAPATGPSGSAEV